MSIFYAEMMNLPATPCAIWEKLRNSSKYSEFTRRRETHERGPVLGAVGIKDALGENFSAIAGLKTPRPDGGLRCDFEAFPQRILERRFGRIRVQVSQNEMLSLASRVVVTGHTFNRPPSA